MPTASGRARRAVTVLPAPATVAVAPPVKSDNVSPPPKPDNADPAAEFRLAAQGYALDALEALATLMNSANSEAVRVSAANALIDRAYGRAAQAVRVGGDNGEDGQGVSLTFT